VGLRVGFQLPFRFPPLVWRLLAGGAPWEVGVGDVASTDASAVAAAAAAGSEGGGATLLGGPAACWLTASSARGAAPSAALPPAAQRLVAAIAPGVAALRAGAGAVVPVAAWRLYTPAQLEEAGCGAPGIDVTMLRRHTRYEGYEESSPVVAAFWRVLAAMAPGEHEAFTRLVNARRRLPPTDAGFTQPFVIARIGRGDPDASFPAAHSCTFQLDLPPYTSDAAMRRQLLRACELSTVYDLDGGATGLR